MRNYIITAVLSPYFGAGLFAGLMLHIACKALWFALIGE